MVSLSGGIINIYSKKGGSEMNIKGWALTAGIGAAAGAVAILMMPKNNATRRLAAKAANKMEDAACKLTNTIGNKMNSMDM